MLQELFMPETIIHSPSLWGSAFMLKLLYDGILPPLVAFKEKSGLGLVITSISSNNKFGEIYN